MLAIAVIALAAYAVVELPETGTISDLVDIGLLGWLVLSIIALVFGWVVPRATHDQQRKDDADDKAELRKDRDEWKAIAQSAVAEIRRIGDLLSDLKAAK